MFNNITVIMNTNGATSHLIEEAIYSVLNQTYQNFKLLIVCIHPSGLRLDKSYPNIEIMNIKPFSRFPEQIYFAINQVKTPYWCIVDSDDYVRPMHLEKLIEGVDKYKHQKAFAIGGHQIIAQGKNSIQTIKTGWHRFAYGAKHAVYMDKDGINRLVFNGWWRTAFSIPDCNLLNQLLDNHKKEYGFDAAIIDKLPWIRIEQDYEPTYLHRYDISYHVSRRRDRPPEHPTNPLSILKPQLYDDYEKRINRYLTRFNFNGEICQMI